MKSYNARVVGVIGTAIDACVRTGTVITSNRIRYTNLGSDLRLEVTIMLISPRVPE